MKKLIALACTLAAAGLALALAQADEDSQSQQSGTLGNDTTEQTTTSNESTTTKSANKSCTDSSGVTYYMGKKGFDQCLSQQKKMDKNRDQMSGSAGSDVNH